MTVPKKADDKSDYKKELDQLGNESDFGKENTNMLKDMYVGAKNKPAKKQAVNTTTKLPVDGVDNPPTMCLELESPNESFNSDETEKDFFIDDADMDTPGMEKSKEMLKTLSNPAGTKETAPRATETPFEVSSNKKEQAKQAARQAQARIANAKNLTELMIRKSLVTREAAPEMAKRVASLDNKSFNLVADIVKNFSGLQASERKATASTKAAGLQTPIHVSKPLPKGTSFYDQFDDAPFSGVPTKTDVEAFRKATNG